MMPHSHTQACAVETLLTHHPHIKTLLFDKNLNQMVIPLDKLDQSLEGLSTSEKLLAHMALDIWDELSEVSMTQITRVLDRKNFHCYIKSLDLLSGTCYAKSFEKYAQKEQNPILNDFL